MTLHMYYGMDGQPIDQAEMIRLFKTPGLRTVARTSLPNGKHVSTVLLVIDHAFAFGGPPMIFETMVFPECEDCERYSTREQALEGHRRMVDKWSKQ